MTQPRKVSRTAAARKGPNTERCHACTREELLNPARVSNRWRPKGPKHRKASRMKDYLGGLIIKPARGLEPLGPERARKHRKEPRMREYPKGILSTSTERCHAGRSTREGYSTPQKGCRIAGARKGTHHKPVAPERANKHRKASHMKEHPKGLLSPDGVTNRWRPKGSTNTDKCHSSDTRLALKESVRPRLRKGSQTTRPARDTEGRIPKGSAEEKEVSPERTHRSSRKGHSERDPDRDHRRPVPKGTPRAESRDGSFEGNQGQTPSGTTNNPSRKGHRKPNPKRDLR